MKVEVLEIAAREFEVAFKEYERKRPGLGEEFRTTLLEQIDKIAKNPTPWVLVRANIRKCLGKKFPYNVIYEAFPDKVLILAIAHKRRVPDYWDARVS